MSKIKAITADIVENNYTRKVIFRVLLVLLAVLFSIYVYFIGSITFNVLARKSLENNIQNLNTEVSQLELVYLNHLNTIDKDYALSQGFTDAKNNLFAVRAIHEVAIR